jgi:hypothetical protein
MKLDTESKMDFDRAIGTEDRFALRRWLDKYVSLQNEHNLEAFSELLSDALIVNGFTDMALQKQSYIDFLKPVVFDNPNAVVRYPKLAVAYQGYLYHIRGDFEIYIDGILSSEGEVEFEVVKDDEQYVIVRKNFSPRMMFAFDM